MSKSGEAFERAAIALAKVKEITVSADKILSELNRAQTELSATRASVEQALKETMSARSDVLNAVGEIRGVESAHRQSVARLESALTEAGRHTDESLKAVCLDVRKLRRRIVWQTIGLVLLALIAVAATVWAVLPSIKSALGFH